MADDIEKKPKFILNKQKSDAASGQPAASASNASEKKKVVVIKKKPVAKVLADASASKKTAAAIPASSEHSGTEKQHALSAKSDEKDAETFDVRKKKENAGAQEDFAVKRTSSVIELSPARPNVKMGNLADRPKGSFSGQRREGGFGKDSQFRHQRREGGFTGAQAREGYQNRSERDSRFNQNGGFSGNAGQRFGQGGARFGGQRQGQNSGRPGFSGQNGTRQQGGSHAFGGRRPGFGAAQAPVAESKKIAAKKVFTKKKTVYSRKDREESLEDKLFNQKKKQISKTISVPERIEIMETVSVSDLAKKMNLKASEIIGKLMSMGMMVSITEFIDADTATLVAAEYNCDVHIVNLYEETIIAQEEDPDEAKQARPPVVTIMGHVDHGKTKTLDAIRSANVAATEFGGITQHIGAYQVETPKGRITFLDTPGHEAFTMMRARGASITDIVVLVVAADDGVMPQTVEAVNHAKDAKVPIVVAVNKIDKPEANPDRVMTQLSEMGLTPEEWGGETQYVRISALKKEGIDELLEAILLQAEILELKANYDCPASGKIIESRIDHGRGIVSTIIVQRGTLHTGDPYVAGVYAGRVRAMFNDCGKKIQKATPSMPVEILGLESMPDAGDPFHVTDTEKTARAISAKRQELKRFETAKNVKKVTLDNLYDTIDAGEVMELKVIIKADVQGSAEALKQSLEKLSTKDIRLVVIHSSAGAINESDVMLASADSNAIIIGFNVRPTPKAKILAEQEKVDIRKYNIIYKAVEEITAAMEGMLKPNVEEENIGNVEVRNTFRVPKVGVIAGAYVLDGVIKRSSNINVVRDGIVVYTGKVSSLKRFKEDAKEVAAGFECGIGIDSWQDIQIGDQLEVFELVEVARKLNDSAASDKNAQPASS
ncbi:MAG: translation initiation factor IF-2 [Bacteroides sp.]|nr:translation initiation factor IF-2 [Prevotella sp.]MCM1407967.1 translation initiation factor IF-2 [Treponema brennaborense]MCM1469709.1 translation initiation factor IF-2 [Bacteroides sp.]